MPYFAHCFTADALMSSEKFSCAVDVKDLVLKAFDIILVSSNALNCRIKEGQI